MNRQFFDARTFLAHVLALTGFVAAFATVLVGPPNGALAASCGHQRLSERCDLATYGGPGGGNFRAECPSGYFLSGVGASAGSYVDIVVATCRQWNGADDGGRTLDPRLWS